MHSPAPMQNGAPYGMTVSNLGGSGIPPPQMQQMMSQGTGMRGQPNMMPMEDMMMNNSYNPNYMNGSLNPQQTMGQNNFNMLTNGSMNNSHGNIMSPHQQSSLISSIPPSQQSTPAPPSIMSPHTQQMMQTQQPTNQIVMYNNTSGQPIMSPGIQSSHQQPNIINQQQYPSQGMSPLPNQGTLQALGHNMIQHQMMSPSQQQSGPMMSPHSHIINQPNNMPPHISMQPQSSGNHSMVQGGMIQPGLVTNRMNIPVQQHMNNSNIMSAGMMSPVGMLGTGPQIQSPLQQQGPQNMMMNSSHQPMTMHHQNMLPGVMIGAVHQPMTGIMNQTTPNSKMFSSNHPIIFNTQNPCGVCNREVQRDTDEAVRCESGCNFWFHRTCINMLPEAYQLLKNEIYAEWACENCIQTKHLAPIKFKS